jgi:hypothetical protein
MKIDFKDVEAVASLMCGSLDEVSYLIAENRLWYCDGLIQSSAAIADEAIKKAMKWNTN